jgi:hypothetical protein
MAVSFTLRELFVGRAGDDQSYEVHYLMLGTRGNADDQNDANAKAFALANTPATWAGVTATLQRQNDQIRTQPIVGREWDWGLVVRYAKPSYSPFNTGDSAFSFDTSGGSQRVTQAIETIGRHVATGFSVRDYKGAIGVNKDGTPEGVDIPAGGFAFTKTKFVSSATMNSTYASLLRTLSGMVNSTPVTVAIDPNNPGVTITFAAGELLYDYTDGGKRKNQGDWEITFHCRASANKTGIQIPATGTAIISGITKDGWDYLWVKYEATSATDGAGGSFCFDAPKQANVERVIARADLTVLNI